MKPQWMYVILSGLLTFGTGTVFKDAQAIGEAPSHPFAPNHQSEPLLITVMQGQAIEVKDVHAFRYKLLTQVKLFSSTSRSSFHSEQHSFYCANFIQEIYRGCGIWIPAHSINGQTRYGQRVRNINALVPGDLVFLSDEHSKSSAHVALYIGEGIVVHPIASHQIVRVSISDPSIKNHYLFATRLLV